MVHMLSPRCQEDFIDYCFEMVERVEQQYKKTEPKQDEQDPKVNTQ